jgi:hypothetical protein
MNDDSFGATVLNGTFAAFGVVRFDGAGSVTGSLTESRPGMGCGARDRRRAVCKESMRSRPPASE